MTHCEESASVFVFVSGKEKPQAKEEATKDPYFDPHFIAGTQRSNSKITKNLKFGADLFRRRCVSL